MTHIFVRNRQSMSNRQIDKDAIFDKSQHFWTIISRCLYLFVYGVCFFYHAGDKFVIVAQSFYNWQYVTGTGIVRIEKWLGYGVVCG